MECILIGGCDITMHEMCPTPALTPEVAGRLWTGIETLEGDALKQLLAGYSEFVSLNPERRSVQMSHCGGLVANIPLRPSQIAALVE